MNKKIYRHGDLLIMELGDSTSNAAPSRSLVLAEGEMTGHVHRVAEAVLERDWSAPEEEIKQALRTAGIMVDDPGFEVLLWIAPAETHITHEEHGRIDLPPRRYVTWRQRQYTWQGVQRIYD